MARSASKRDATKGDAKKRRRKKSAASRQNETFEAVRQILTTKDSDRAIAAQMMSKTTVGALRKRVKALGLVWKGQVDAMAPGDLQKALLSLRQHAGQRTTQPNWERCAEELRTSEVTVHQLWLEYSERAERPMSYSRFTARLKRLRSRRELTMRKVYQPGEQVMVDYSGRLISYVDPETGQDVRLQVLVLICPYSNLIYATATRTQSKADFIMGCARGLEYFGGAPLVCVTDNLKAAVVKPGHEPHLQRDFMAFAAHFNMACRPAKVRKPKYKAPVENAVRLVKYGILLALRHAVHYSLDEVNAAIAEKLERLNNRTMKFYGQSRWERYNTLERSTMQPLPEVPYEYAEWVHIREVPEDYHVRVAGQLYSVPYGLVGDTVEVRLTFDRVQVYRDGKRVADHRRSPIKGATVTEAAHRPAHHQAVANDTVQGALDWAKEVGPHTTAWLQAEFARTTNPQVALKEWRLMKSLAFKHGAMRFERAVMQAEVLKSVNITSVRRLVAPSRATIPASRALKPNPFTGARTRDIGARPAGSPPPLSPRPRGGDSPWLH